MYQSFFCGCPSTIVLNALSAPSGSSSFNPAQQVTSGSANNRECHAYLSPCSIDSRHHPPPHRYPHHHQSTRSRSPGSTRQHIIDPSSVRRLPRRTQPARDSPCLPHPCLLISFRYWNGGWSGCRLNWAFLRLRLRSHCQLA